MKSEILRDAFRPKKLGILLLVNLVISILITIIIQNGG